MGELLWWHRVGQAVVCVREIDPQWHRLCRLFSIRLPQLDDVYHIREVMPDADGVACFRLREIRNPAAPHADVGMAEPAFSHEYFRPTRETSIDQFRELLNPTPERRNAFEGMPEVEHA